MYSIVTGEPRFGIGSLLGYGLGSKIINSIVNI